MNRQVLSQLTAQSRTLTQRGGEQVMKLHYELSRAHTNRTAADMLRPLWDGRWIRVALRCLPDPTAYWDAGQTVG